MIKKHVDKAVIIFVKNPMKGKVKTRLARTLGEDKALNIYKLLLEHTRLITRDLPFDKYVYYSDYIDYRDEWDNSFYHKRIQFGIDLGARMRHSFNELFIQGYRKIVIIGSDCYQLKEAHIEKAFEQLAEKEAVIGPAEDGGFYLLGIKRLIPRLFKDKEWGTGTVLEKTINDLVQLNIPLSTLERLSDVDEEEDIPTEILDQLINFAV